MTGSVPIRQRHAPAPDIEEVSVLKVFGNEVLSVRWLASDLDIAMLRAIEQAAAHEDSLAKSNVGGWHSNTDLLERGGPFDPFERRLRAVLQGQPTLGGDDRLPVECWSLCAWANVLRDGHSHRPHCHGPETWSGVYYLRVPDGCGGGLRFHDMGFSRRQTRGSAASVCVQPEERVLLVFPGYLWHSVDRWEGPGERVSVAFNAWCSALLSTER